MPIKCDYWGNYSSVAHIYGWHCAPTRKTGRKKGRRKEGRKENKGAEEEFSRLRKLSLKNLTFCRCCQW